MAMDPDIIINLMKKAFPEGHVELKPLIDDGDHYEITVTSHTFSGKTKIQQHQMVYGALGSKMGVELHALSIKTKTPT